MKIKRLIIALCVLGFSKNLHAQQLCYSISDSENKVYKFDLSNGTTISSQTLSSLASPEASTLDLAGDTLWILNADVLNYIPVTTTLANTAVSGSNISGQQLGGSEGNLYI